MGLLNAFSELNRHIIFAVEYFYCNMNKSEILEKMRSIGFKENESKVLFVLLGGSLLSASQIAEDAKIIRNSIYDILKEFVKKGYCNEIETNTILKYQCIDPDVLKDKIEREFNRINKHKIETLHNVINEIYDLHKKTNTEINTDNSVNIELVRGYNKHRMEKYIEYLKRSDKRVLGLYRLRGIVSSELDKIAVEFIRRGGELRSIYSINLDFKIIKNGNAVPASREDLVKVCQRFEDSGEILRLSQMDIPNMTIFDDEIVFNNITDPAIPKNKSADVIIKNKSNAKYMTDLFEFYWDNSMTLKDFRNKEL